MVQVRLSACFGFIAAANASPNQQQENDQHQYHRSRGLQQQQLLDCNNNENLVAFDLLLDDHPEETGFALTCDSVDVWYVKPGAYKTRSMEWITQRACVPTNVKTCTLTIVDTNGDGLNGDGWYSLEVGKTSVAIYDQSTFSTKSYCFGSKCNQAPAKVSDMTQECKPVKLRLGLDSNPSETSVKLVCDGELLWNVKQLNTPFQNIKLDACVQSYDCCHFTINDSGNDGLIAGNANQTGYFALEADYQDKMHYSGEDGMQFSTLSVAFGNDNTCSVSQITSQVAANYKSSRRGFDVGAVIGSFLGGVVATVLLFGAILSVWKASRLSVDAQLFSVSSLHGEQNTDDGSKLSIDEQMTTAWSDAEHSL
jgi:hypothetical protein